MNIDYVRVYQPDSKASINELSGFSRLYPNPTNDELYLNSNSPVFSYTISTLDGRILDAQHTSTPLEIIYTKQLSPGSYIITFEQNNKLIRQIIQKN